LLRGRSTLALLAYCLDARRGVVVAAQMLCVCVSLNVARRGTHVPYI
jgi:hypothetical protein